MAVSYTGENIAKVAAIFVDIYTARTYYEGDGRERGSVTMPNGPTTFDARQIVKRPEFDLQYRRDSYLKKVDLHHHDFYEIFFLISGDVTYTIESKLYKVEPGDILLISPKELHQIYIRPEREAYERYVLWVDPRAIKRLSTKHTDLTLCLDPGCPRYRNQLHMTPEDRRRIYEIVEKLYGELHDGEFGGELMPECLLTLLLVEINRVAQREAPPAGDVTRVSQVVGQVVEYISRHYGESLRLEELAGRFFVSKYHLSHEFNRLVGTSVHRYILKKRLQIARAMMAQGVKPSQVWTECGFGDYTGFYRAFKAEYGITPREYAQSVR